MPIYVYECNECKKQFEVQQKISDAPLKDCECGAKNSLKKIIQPIAVMFKGSGFHINDYAPKAESISESTTPVGNSKETSNAGTSDSQQASTKSETTKSTEAATPVSNETTKPMTS